MTIDEHIEEINKIIEQIAIKRLHSDGSTNIKPTEDYLYKEDFDFIKNIKTYQKL